MNTNNLFKGMVIKNYKELCSLLGLKETTGKSKILQLEDIQRYLKYINNKREFIIEEIYDIPMEKTDNRKGGNNVIYREHLEFLLLDYLARRRYNDSFNLIELTSKDIAVITGMCKREYLTKTFEQLKAEYPHITRYDNAEIRRRFESKIHKTIEQLLKSLETNSVIYKQQGHKIKKPIGDNTYAWFRATEQEELSITETKREVMRLMKKESDPPNFVPTIRTIIMRFQLDEFYELVNERLMEYFGWEEIYFTYFIGFSKKLENDIQDYVKTFPELASEKIKLNSKIVEYMDKEADTIYKRNKAIYDKAMEKCFGWSDKIYKPKFDYIERQQLLSKVLIKLDEPKQK